MSESLVVVLPILLIIILLKIHIVKYTLHH